MSSRKIRVSMSAAEVEKRAEAMDRKMSQLEVSDDEGISEGAREYAEAMGDFADSEYDSDDEEEVYRTSPAATPSAKSSSPLYAPISPPPAKVGAGWTMDLAMHIPNMNPANIPPPASAPPSQTPEWSPTSPSVGKVSSAFLGTGTYLSTPWRRQRPTTSHPSPKYEPGSPNYSPHTDEYGSTTPPWRPSPQESERTFDGAGDAMDTGSHTPEPMQGDPYDADDSDLEESGPRASGWSPGLAPKNKRLDAVTALHATDLADPDTLSLPEPALPPLGSRKRKAEQVLVKHSASGVVDRKVKKLKKKKTAEELDAEMEDFFSTLR